MQTYTVGTSTHIHPETLTAAVLASPSRTPKRIPQRDVNVCLDRDILASLRATGPDWQARFNAILREWLETHSPTQ
ncbi:MAG: BrnA antitoxin family protein [Azoarcus sp.]|jgi:uncharacterized protein (DUF4415 family)|nr:BrnA antitoxin family protein [Azoarcus sp.]